MKPSNTAIYAWRITLVRNSGGITIELELKKFKKNKKGFTLVEVIIVLVILAILASIMVPSMIGWIGKAESKTAVVEGRSILVAMQTIVSENYKTYTGTGAQTGLTAQHIAETVALADVGVVTFDSPPVISNGKVMSFVCNTPSKYKVTYSSTAGFSVTKN